MVLLLTKDVKLQQFRCPSCNLRVQGDAYQIQRWTDAHCFDCSEKRVKVHVLDEAGRIQVAGE